jgi:tetratricopeptide (TPR) repeat protein
MRINTVKVKEKAPLYGQRITVLLLELSFLFVIAVNFFKANHKPFTITEDYINEAYSYIPDNSLVLVTGDISDMTSDYFKYLKVGNKHIMMFTPGQFHMPWFTQQVVERYPNVVIPLPESDKRFTNATQIIDANYGKWSIYIDPDLVTHSPQLEEKYTLYPEHLLFLVKRKGEEVKLEGYREVNDDMWRKVNLEQIKLIQRNSPMFEETIIFYYCRHFYNVGSVFEDVKLYDDAIKNYMRVLEIDPYFKNALAALGRVYGYKIKEPNYMTAIDYLRKYQSVLNPTKDYELGQSAQSMIEELQGKMQKAAEEEKQLQEVEKKQEATESAKM